MKGQMDSKEYWRSLVNIGLTRLLILKILTSKPSHGYAVLEEVSKFTEGCCYPTYGAIYPILKELEEGDYCHSQYKTVNGRKRKIYHMNDKGDRAYQKAMEAWNEVLPYLIKIISS